MTSTLKMEKILCLVAVLFVTGSFGADSTAAPVVVVTTEAPTTMKPTTTTTAPTMAPTITPPKSDNGTGPITKKYIYTDPTTKMNCILSEMAVKFIFSYVKKDAENKTMNVGIEWNLPNNTMVTNKSHCGNHTQKLVLSFFEQWELTLNFNKSQKGDKFEVNSTSLMFVSSNYRFEGIILDKDKIEATTTTNEVMFSWKEKTSLKCHSDVDLKGFSATNVNVTLVDLQTSTVIMEAFRTTNTTEPSKGPYTYCPADTSVSNIVPISVGAALAGLVLIVLIAYLIGRSRNQRGYESV